MKRIWPLMICGALLVIFATLSWSAARTKNATIDEPAQALAGLMELRYGDFRMEPVSPPLWQCWAALGNWRTPIRLTFDAPVWNDRSWDPQGEVVWASRTLYGTSGNDGEKFIQRSRAMMLMVGVVLGAMIGWWAFRLGGIWAAIIAMAMYCFDPNFLGHAPLAKADVAFGLVMLALAYAVWKLQKRVSITNVIWIGVLCGIGINVKFSGVILGPMLGLMLLRWTSMDWRKRWMTAVMIGVVCGIFCIAVSWACYGFRFRPAPGLNVRMDMAAIQKRAILIEATVIHPDHLPSDAELATWHPGATIRVIDFLDRHRLLPQAMLAGFLYQHACVQLWPAFLMGQLYGTGRWYYFPMATLFKMPVVSLVLIAAGVLFWITRRAWWTWNAACLAIPVCLFGGAALLTHLNIGFRNVLPIFPFLFIASGVAAAKAAARWGRVARVIAGVCLIGLVAESAFAWPDYIAFFNVAAGGERGGFDLLSDSNLDWGQDIKSLVGWQQQHPDVPIWLDYYGTVDPNFYGLRYQPLVIGANQPIDGVLAVSVTHLQGLYIKPDEREFFARLAQRKPDEIVGGTIYLYRVHSPSR